MLERTGPVAYQDCDGKYRRVRRLVEESTQDPTCQSRIYQVLFRHGGRCDCTVDRNIVAVPGRLAVVEEEIGKVVAGGSPDV